MNFFKDKVFLKSVLMIAIPIALTNLLTALLNIVDGIMVAALPPEIADHATSAVRIVNQYIFVFQILIFALCSAACIFISRYWGKGDKASIPPVFGFILIIGLIISVVVTIISIAIPDVIISAFVNRSDPIHTLASNYLRVVAISFIPNTVTIVFTFTLRAVKVLRLSVITSIIAISLNIVFNYAFMFGKLGMPELGLIGAAWGTVISRAIETIIVVVCVVLLKYPIVGKFKDIFSADKAFRSAYYKMLGPVMINEVLWVIGITVYTMVFARLPNNETVLAAANVTQTMDGLLGVMMIGIGSATGIVIGNTIGSDDIEKAKDYSKKAISFSIFVGVLIGSLMFACSYFVPQLFVNLSDASRLSAAKLMRVFGISQVFRTINFVIFIGILRAGGDAKFCMVMEALTMWLIAVPTCLIAGFVFNLEVHIIYLLIFIEAAIKSVICFFRVKSGKWLKIFG